MAIALFKRARKQTPFPVVFRVVRSGELVISSLRKTVLEPLFLMLRTERKIKTVLISKSLPAAAATLTVAANSVFALSIVNTYKISTRGVKNRIRFGPVEQKEKSFHERYDRY